MRKTRHFRHSVSARTDVKIQAMIEKFGPAGYFYFFALLEIVCQHITNPDDHVLIHASTLRQYLAITTRKLNQCLTFMESICLLDVTFVEHAYQIKIRNLSKYFGNARQTNRGNIREDKIKENKIREDKRREDKTQSIGDALKDYDLPF